MEKEAEEEKFALFVLRGREGTLPGDPRVIESPG